MVNRNVKWLQRTYGDEAKKVCKGIEWDGDEFFFETTVPEKVSKRDKDDENLEQEGRSNEEEMDDEEESENEEVKRNDKTEENDDDKERSWRQKVL